MSDGKAKPKKRSDPTILDESVIYILVSYKRYQTMAEISQNDFIVRNPDQKELIREQFSKLFVKINDCKN